MTLQDVALADVGSDMVRIVGLGNTLVAQMCPYVPRSLSPQLEELTSPSLGCGFIWLFGCYLYASK